MTTETQPISDPSEKYCKISGTEKNLKGRQKIKRQIEKTDLKIIEQILNRMMMGRANNAEA